MPNEILTRAIDAVCSGEHLTADHASAVLAEIMEGRAGEVQTGAFLVALRAKGETVPELIGLARTMRSLATHVETGRTDLVDTAGTGGGPSTFNVSTTAALIAAGAGCAVAKHGNRSSTSRSGSADMLEALGVEITLTPEQVGEAIRRTGFGFMFAPAHHAAMKHVIPVRARARRPDDLQLPRPAHQSGGSDPAAARRLRPPLPGDDRRGARRARLRARARGHRRRRPRRDLDRRADPGHRGPRTGARANGSPSRPSSGSPRRPWRRSPAASRRRTRRPRGPSSPASTARPPTSPCSTPGPRSTSAAPPTTSPRASTPHGRRSTPAPLPRSSASSSRCEAPVRMADRRSPPLRIGSLPTG